MSDVRNIVLVHGGFVDGSGWRGVYDALTADGYNVSVVQNQTLSLESDHKVECLVVGGTDFDVVVVERLQRRVLPSPRSTDRRSSRSSPRAQGAHTRDFDGRDRSPEERRSSQR